MTPKYTPCKNCGANEYEIKSLNTLECEYCGTEYVIEVPEIEFNNAPYVSAMFSTCLMSTVPVYETYNEAGMVTRRSYGK